MDNYTIDVNGKTFNVTIEHDDTYMPPWIEEDGHGIVSDWETRPKRAGELVLNSDRYSKRFYDFAATIKTATAEGWGLSELKLQSLRNELKREPTKRDIVAHAVQLNFEHLRAWCNDEWCYVGVMVECEGETAALWGVSNDDSSYVEQVAIELAEELAIELDKKVYPVTECGV